MPNVLMLGWGYPPNVTGGLDTHVGEVFDRLVERDAVEAELVLPAQYAPADRPRIRGVETGDGDIITRIGRLSEEFATRAADADVVHTHDWFGYGPGSRARANNDVTWVSSFHSLSSDRNVDPPQREVETERRVVDGSDHLVAVSHLTAEKVAEEYGGDPHVVHNGYTEPDVRGYDARAEAGLAADEPMLLFVGRHTDQKGIAYLLYAMRRLRNTEATLVVGGSGHQTAQLEKFVELLDVEDRVAFPGYIPEEKLGDYYAAADVFVSPSLAEPFGITVTEALATGCQVVATESGVLETLAEGVVVEADVDSASIAAAIREALAREAPPEYEPRTWDEVVDDYVALYREVVD